MRVLLAVAAAALLITVIPTAAGAEEPRFLTPADLGPGTCTPGEVLMFQDVDCRFPLLEPDLSLDPYGGPYLADGDWTFDEDNDEQAACVVEGDHLVCRAIPTYYSPGRHVVTLQWGWQATQVTAGFTVIDTFDVAAEFVAIGAREPYVLAGRPLRMWVYDSAPPGAVWAKVRTRDGDRVVATVPVPDGPAAEPTELALAGVPPGHYRLQPCVGPDPIGCDLVPGSVPVQVGSGELLEVIPGWNRPESDRINLILAGSGFEDFDTFATIARRLLTLDGPLLLGEDLGTPLPADAEPGAVWSIEFGPFATEPLRSSIQKFNLWLLADDVADHHALFQSPLPNGTGWVDGSGFGLPDVQVTTLHFLPTGLWRRSEASWPSFTGIGPDVPDRSDLQFAGAYVAVDTFAPLNAADTLTHELGHALFDLRDEYIDYARSVYHGYPNCAPDRETGEQWWGEMVGSVDPFVDEYIELLESYGIWMPETLRDDVAVGFVPGGCYDEDPNAAVRPTAESIMNGQTPVFGMVNRARVEEILGLWSGRGPVVGPDLAMDCFGAGTAADLALCRGSISELAIVPSGGLEVSFGGLTAPCRIGPAGDQMLVACDPLRLPGPGTWGVGIGPAGAEPVDTVLVRTGGLRIDAPVETVVTTTTTTPTTTTTTAPPPAPSTTLAAAPDPSSADPGGGAMPGWIVAGLAGAAAVAAGGLAWARARRR